MLFKHERYPFDPMRCQARAYAAPFHLPPKEEATLVDAYCQWRNRCGLWDQEVFALAVLEKGTYDTFMEFVHKYPNIFK